MLDADGDVDTCWQVEFFKFINSASGRIDDIENAFVSADFELFSGLFVDVNRTVNAEFFDAGRKRNRTSDTCASAFCCLHDFKSRAIDGTMVESTQADPDVLS